MNLKMCAIAIALVPSLSTAVHAQTSAAAAPPDSATRTVIQAQLNAPAPGPSRVGGAEADAIYKRYVAGIGQQLVPSATMTSSAVGHGGGSQ
jgi:hypothetical protein